MSADNMLRLIPLAEALKDFDEAEEGKWHTLKVIFKKEGNSVYMEHLDLRKGEYDLVEYLPDIKKIMFNKETPIAKIIKNTVTRIKRGLEKSEWICGKNEN
jgi:hypothetical protein